MNFNRRNAQQVNHLGNENGGQNFRPNPHAWTEPLTFHVHRALAQVEHHDYENEQHHDGAGVDDDFQGGDKGRAQDVKDDGYRQQRHNEIEQGVNGIEPGDGHHRGENGNRSRNVEQGFHRFLGHQAAQIRGRRLALGLALVFAADVDPGHPPEVVVRVLAGTADQQVFLFVNHVLAVIFAHLSIGRELDGIGRACLFAITAENATRKIDAEKFRIAAPGIVLRGLQGDAIDGAGHRAQIAGHASLPAFGITRENDAPAVARREVGLLLRVLDGHPPPEGVQKNVPQGSNYAQHKLPLSLIHKCLQLKNASLTAPVTSRLASASGSMSFHPQSMSWSKRGRGSDARSKMKNPRKKNVLMKYHTMPGSSGPCQPPKNNTVIMEEISRIPMYSPTKNMPNFMPEYSEWKPATISLSDSGRSKGKRRVSAIPAIMNNTNPRNCGTTNHKCRCALTLSTRSKEPASSTVPISDRPIKTS